jgi:dihydroorotate dehydrogenase electron transfer subunit
VAGAAAAARPLQRNRGTIFLEDAVVLTTRNYPAGQYILRLQAPKCARHAMAGSFIHIQCAPDILMRRPLSIMRANAAHGWIEVLFKQGGSGLRALSHVAAGETRSTLGPVGRGFTIDPATPNCLLVGGGVGIPPVVFLAEQMRSHQPDCRPLVLMGSEIPFPFTVTPSKLACDWLPGIDGSMPLLEEQGICSRLASLAGLRDCYRGFVTDLARRYLDGLSESERRRTQIFSCGPTPMLRAVAALAREYGLPCQVSVEEFMACATGGCAGCTIEVQTDDGPAMKRVCVDGPVFEARSVFP